ncbi:MAG: tyrosine-type recombinase/integrase [Flavobacteriales bacterium]|nr:tyrosine-type recombinase/integrase [Flavobacteriales bacterium]
MKTIETYLDQQFSEASARRYLRAIGLYIEHETEEKAHHNRYRDIWNYIGVLRDRNYSTGYVTTELAGIKAYYRYLIEVGIRTDNPTRSIYLNDAKRKNRQVQHQDMFSVAELELLLQKENRYALLKNKMKLAISFYIYQGMTTGELESLTIHDIDVEEGTVIIRASKRLNSRILHLKNNQRLFLENYLNHDRPKLLRTETDQLFITKLGTIEKGESFHYLIESQRDMFAERTLNPKTVRQSVITNWFRQGLGIKEVQIMAGHRFPSTTEGYRPTDLGQLSDAIGRFHPLG